MFRVHQRIENKVKPSLRNEQSSAQNEMVTLCNECAEMRENGSMLSSLNLANTAIDAFPNALRPRLELARTLTKSGQDLPGAIAAWQSCIDNFPNLAKPFWFISLRQVLLKSHGNLRFSPDQEKFIQAQEKIHHQALLIWPDIPDGFEPKDKDERQLKEKTDKISVWIDLGRAEVLSQIGNHEASLLAWETYFSHHEFLAKPKQYIQYIRALSGRGQENSAPKIEALFQRARLKSPREIFHDNCGNREITPLKNECARLDIAHGEWLLNQDRYTEACNVLANIPDYMPQADLARELETVARSVSMMITHKDLSAANPDISDSNSNAILPWRCKNGSEKIIFAFTGFAGRLSLTLTTIHLTLRQFGCHIVYLTDTDGQFYIRGSEWNTPGELCDLLRNIAREFGATRYFTLGSSSGGYGALRYGLDLGAEAVLAYSPLITPEINGWAATRKTLGQFRKNIPGFEPNLDVHFANSKTHPKVTIAYGAQCDGDRISAELMKNLPNVTLAPADGLAHHASLRWNYSQGLFVPQIRNLLGEDP